MVPLLSLARQHEDDLNEATPLTAVIDGRDASVDFAYMLGAAQKSKVSVPLLSSRRWSLRRRSRLRLQRVPVLSEVMHKYF